MAISIEPAEIVRTMPMRTVVSAPAAAPIMPARARATRAAPFVQVVMRIFPVPIERRQSSKVDYVRRNAFCAADCPAMRPNTAAAIRPAPPG